MAGKYRKLDPRFWTDEKVVPLPPDQKLIAVYCMTSPQTNRIGIFQFSIGMGAEHTGMLPQTFREGFEKVCRALGWGYDQTLRVLYLPNWWKYNQPQNPNVLIGCLEDLHDLPQTYLISEFTSNTKHLDETLRVTFTQTLAKRYPKPSPIQEQEQEQDIKDIAEPENPPVTPAWQEAMTNLGDDLKPQPAPKSRGHAYNPNPIFGGGIPSSLNTPEFQAAWKDWQQHSAELGKPLTTLCAREALTRCEGMGPERAVAMIRHSIASNSKGSLFEEKQATRPVQQSRQAQTAAVRAASEVPEPEGKILL